MISQFQRANYGQIAITLSADETLGLLDSAYLQDYNGNDGQLSLFNEFTGIRYPVLMGEIPELTPEIPHDVFRGYFQITGRPNGLYWLQGRLRDVVGNYTVLGQVANPIGNERVLNIGIDVVPGFGISKSIAIKLTGVAVSALRVGSFPKNKISLGRDNSAVRLGGLTDW